MQRSTVGRDDPLKAHVFLCETRPGHGQAGQVGSSSLYCVDVQGGVSEIHAGLAGRVGKSNRSNRRGGNNNRSNKGSNRGDNSMVGGERGEEGEGGDGTKGALALLRERYRGDMTLEQAAELAMDVLLGQGPCQGNSESESGEDDDEDEGDGDGGGDGWGEKGNIVHKKGRGVVLLAVYGDSEELVSLQ